MTTRRTDSRASSRADKRSHLDMVQQTRDVARAALDGYGQPTMSLAELRAAMDRHLSGGSLSDVIVKQRQESR